MDDIITKKMPGEVFLYILITAFVYFLSAKLVTPLSLKESSSIFAIWPPTGVALSLLLFRGYSVLPGIFLGALFLNMTIGAPVVAFEIAVGNTLGPAAVYWFISNSDTKENIFHDTDAVIGFVIFCVMGAFITSSLGTTMLYLNGFLSPINQMLGWLVWFVADLVGFIMIVPIFVAYFLDRDDRGAIKKYNLEILLIFAILSASVIIMFASNYLFDDKHYPVEYLILIPLMWATMRFNYGISRIFLSIAILLSIIGTVLGYTHFVFEGDYRLSLALLQFFIFTVTVIILLMTAQHCEAVRVREEKKDSLEG